MRASFLGIFEATVQRDGRIILPATFRQSLPSEAEGSTLVALPGADRCIALYPSRAFKAWLDEAGRDAADASCRRSLRWAMAKAEFVTCDRHGRFRLPDALMSLADIERGAEETRRVLFIGAVDHLEVWERDRWQRNTLS